MALRAAESNPGVLEAALAADASVVAPRTRSKKKKEKADICAAAPAAEAASAPDKASQPVGRGIDDPTNPIVSMRNRQLAHMSVNRALLVDPLMDWLDLELAAKMATLNHTVRDRIGEWRARQEYVSLRGVDGVAGGTCFTRGPGADDLIAEVVGPVADAALRVVMRSYSNLTTLDLTGCLYSTELLLDLPKVCKKLLRIVDAEFQWNDEMMSMALRRGPGETLRISIRFSRLNAQIFRSECNSVALSVIGETLGLATWLWLWMKTLLFSGRCATSSQNIALSIKL